MTAPPGNRLASGPLTATANAVGAVAGRSIRVAAREAQGITGQRHVRVIAWKDEADDGPEETAFTAEIQPVDAQ
ncbi:hypothetical protein ABZ656_47880 [Streptomyces sp. NPDC007095]|jgi:hypothetical protein|uniref:hypothetical protein n=1 Tax=Streptomyces sp. NPDC007095 TaxID=3154482 RepID=UPI000C70A48F